MQTYSVIIPSGIKKDFYNILWFTVEENVMHTKGKLSKTIVMIYMVMAVTYLIQVHGASK